MARPAILAAVTPKLPELAVAGNGPPDALSSAEYPIPDSVTVIELITPLLLAVPLATARVPVNVIWEIVVIFLTAVVSPILVGLLVEVLTQVTRLLTRSALFANIPTCNGPVAFVIITLDVDSVVLAYAYCA